MKSKTIHQDVYVSTVLYAVLIFLTIGTSKLLSDSAIFPFILIGVFAVLNTVMLYGGIKKTKAMREENSEIVNSISFADIKIPLLVFLFVVIYVALFKFTNYFIATTVFMVAIMKFYKVKSWKSIVLVTIFFNIIIYFGFVKMLHVPLI